MISLDITPTALSVACAEKSTNGSGLDGTNILPYLTGAKTGEAHDSLFWRFRFPPDRPELHRRAIRKGDWKLVQDGDHKPALYEVSTDISETKDLSAEKPELVANLSEEWKRWDSENKEPVWDCSSTMELKPVPAK